MSGKTRVIPDTNVILRYLLRDVPDQFAEAARFFEEVRNGEQRAEILEGVLVECVYVLMKFYHVPRQETVAGLSGLLRYKGIVNEDKEELLAALALFAKENIALVDCIVIARGRQGQAEIFSFDRKLNKLAGGR